MIERFSSLFGEGKKRKMEEELNFLFQELDRLLIQREKLVEDCILQAYRMNVVKQIVQQESLHVPELLSGGHKLVLPNPNRFGSMIDRTPRFGNRAVVVKGREFCCENSWRVQCENWNCFKSD